jgi:hypothetical protein
LTRWDGVTFEHENTGWLCEVGRLNDRPITVGVQWRKVESERIAFIEATSALVDWDMIERWQKTVFPNAVLHVDAANFGDVIRSIGADGSTTRSSA